MDTGFCLNALLEELVKYGVPSIFNTDAYTSIPAMNSLGCLSPMGSSSAWMASGDERTTYT